MWEHIMYCGFLNVDKMTCLLSPFFQSATPKIVSVPPSVSVLHNKLLSIRCMAEGFNISVTWIQPSTATGATITQNRSADNMAVTSILSKSAAQWNKDGGTYTCEITKSGICNNTGTSGGTGHSPCQWTNEGPLRQDVQVTVRGMLSYCFCLERRAALARVLL